MNQHRREFTLIELLVVIAIIALLMARLMPALQVLLALDKSSLSTLNPNQRKYHTTDETEFLRATFIHVTLPHR